MKQKTRFIVLALLLGSASAGGEGVQLGTLRIIVEGMKSQQGQLKVGLEKTAQDFDKGPLHEARYRGETVAIKGASVVVQFQDVPFGAYAVKTFHDADGNGILNTNFMGIPTEDYGFSNNARGTLGPATFQEASFAMDAADKTITIRVK